jgi:hypothetical protein
MKFLSTRNIGWLIGSFVLSLVFVVLQKTGPVAQAGFLTKTLCVLAGGCLGFLGFLIGDGLRRFTTPDALFTNGGIGSILMIKLFWLYGPQIIGMVIGVCLGISWMA